MALGLGLGLGLTRPQQAAAAAGGDWTEITWTHAFIIDTASVYEADDASDVCENDGDDVVRVYGTTMPANLDHLKDFASTYGNWRDGANGINGKKAIQFQDSSAVLREQDGAGTWTAADAIAIDASLIIMAGKVDAHDATSDRPILGIGASSDANAIPRAQVLQDDTVQWRQNSQVGVATLDGSNRFLYGVWFHDGVIDWWNARTKQTQITSVSNFGALTGALMTVNGATNVDWTLAALMISAGHTVEADVQDAMDHFADFIGLA